jgi:phosphate starvation-inducible protein PhoH
MSKRNSRRNKQLSEEELREVEEFVYSNNAEEEKFLQTMKINVKCKTENQKKLVNSIKENEITICSGLPGSGKAQPLYSKILTPNGWTTMGEIKPGDKVVTPKGEISEVVNTFPQGEKDIYRITFSDGRQVDSCDEHLWKVKYRHWSEDKVLTLREIIDNHSKKIDEKRLYIPLVESTGNVDVDLPMNPYLLGALIGDGGFTNNTLSFTNKDEIVLEHVDSHLREENYMLEKRKYGKYDYGIKSIDTIKVSGKKGVFTNKIKMVLDDLGIYNRKSENKFIPEVYKTASKRQKLDLIRGLMDTDGTTDTINCSLSFSTSSKQLSEDFVELIQSIGGIAKVTIKNPKYTYNGEVREGLTNYNINIRYPNPEELFYLPRKKDVCEKYQYRNLNLRIDSIEYVGKLESKCIMIDDPEHLYITDNYIVTHNTFLSCAEALKLIKTRPKYKRIVLVKSITPLKNEEIGHLPGNLEEKMAPIMESFTDNIRKLIGKTRMEKLIELGVIEIVPIAFARGRSIDNSIILIDEAQNISLDNIRTLMTRIGDNSKMVIMGDVKQKDIRNKRDSSLEIVLRRFDNVEGFGCVELRDPNDVVRNPIIKIVEQVFDDMEEGNN